MLLGSSMTTMSVCITVLIVAAPPTVSAFKVALIVFFVINCHYLLPFHHVLIMTGEGEGYYDSKTTLQYGIYLTLLMFVAVFAVVLPYWSLL